MLQIKHVFKANPTAIPILLYSDGLCLTNPLNANAAKKNKLSLHDFWHIPVWGWSKVDGDGDGDTAGDGFQREGSMASNLGQK
jgi:hypothetical protein